MSVTPSRFRQVPDGSVPCRTGSGLRRLGGAMPRLLRARPGRVIPELPRVRPVGFGARHDCGIRTLEVVA